MENNLNMGKDIILVVDDQPANLKVISSAINNEYILSIANSGDKALKVLEKVKPDLILLDIMMPEMDGYELCQKIKQDKRFEEIPIIFLTAKVDSEDIVKGFSYGAVDYITKPFNIKEVKVRIQNHLNLSRAKKIILNQKADIENQNYRLQQAQNVLHNRNEELIAAKDAIEENAYNLIITNQQLAESEEKLQIANDELSRTNKEKDKFFSILAHDLKSPFNGLIGILQIINDEKDSMSETERQELIAALLNSAKNVYALLENLLDWSRIQRKVTEFNPENFSPYMVVNNIIETVLPLLNAKSISINNNVDEKLEVKADIMMISTVFRNLISNSIKFTEFNGQIGIRVEEVSEEKITFAVQDNGVGISPKNLEKLFRIDEHITSIGTANEKGTGLGLILCKEFVELHKGAIWVETQLKLGSTFYFSISKNMKHKT